MHLELGIALLKFSLESSHVLVISEVLSEVEERLVLVCNLIRDDLVTNGRLVLSHA